MENIPATQSNFKGLSAGRQKTAAVQSQVFSSLLSLSVFSDWLTARFFFFFYKRPPSNRQDFDQTHQSSSSSFVPFLSFLFLAGASIGFIYEVEERKWQRETRRSEESQE